MQTSFVNSIDQVNAADWQSLATVDNPFVSHAYLQALEESGSVGGSSGWQVHHLLLHDQQRLVGAAPCYIKQHSYGEYVFDWGWANAYQRAGLAYYPKMVCAVPFTPAAGSRLLTVADQVKRVEEIRVMLANALIEEAQRLGASSVHCLFLPEEEAALLVEQCSTVQSPSSGSVSSNSGWLPRHDIQFHWRNQGYQQFSDYLAAFSSKKRKNVNRERRRVREAGVVMEVRGGEELDDEHWELFYRLYRHTAFKRGGTAYLTEQFFQLIAQRMAKAVVMVLARVDDRYVAAALNFRGADTLYGRYWGCQAEYDSLHFETCYYSAIEYCIAEGIDCYEAGAQGEHKLSRGFLPTTTRSVHWLAHPQFADAVADYLEDEREQIAGYQSMLQAHTPFREP